MWVSAPSFWHRVPKTLAISWVLRALRTSFVLAIGLWPLFLTQFLNPLELILSYSSVFWSNAVSHGARLDGSCAPGRPNHELSAPLPLHHSPERRGAGNGISDWPCCHKNPLSTGFRKFLGWWTHPCSGRATGTEVCAPDLPYLTLFISSDCSLVSFIIFFNKRIDVSVSAFCELF